MIHTPVEFRSIAYCRPIELHSLSQRKTTILFKYIDNLYAIAQWRWLADHLLFSGHVLLCQPLLLLFLGNQDQGIANCVCSAAMPRPGIGNKEKYRSLR